MPPAIAAIAEATRARFGGRRVRSRPQAAAATIASAAPATDARTTDAPTARSTGFGTRRPSMTSATTAATEYAPLQASARPCTPSVGNRASARPTFSDVLEGVDQNGVRVSASA